MMAILWFHTEYYYAGYVVTPYACYVGDVLAAFFFISGYLFKNKSPFRARHKALQVLRKLVVPYFIFTLAFLVPKAIVHGNMGNIDIMLIDIFTSSASWFVPALVVSELLFIFVISLSKERTVPCVLFATVCLLMTAFFANDLSHWHNPYNYWHINEALFSCFFMSAGYLFRKYENYLIRYDKPTTTAILLIACIFLKTIILRQNEIMIVGPVITTNFPLFIIDLSVSVMMLTTVFSFVQWTGSHTIVYYFICGGVPLLTATTFTRLGLAWNGWHTTIPVFITVYIIATFITYAIYRWMPFIIGKKQSDQNNTL